MARLTTVVPHNAIAGSSNQHNPDELLSEGQPLGGKGELSLDVFGSLKSVQGIDRYFVGAES